MVTNQHGDGVGVDLALPFAFPCPGSLVAVLRPFFELPEWCFLLDTLAEAVGPEKLVAVGVHFPY